MKESKGKQSYVNISEQSHVASPANETQQQQPKVSTTTNTSTQTSPSQSEPDTINVDFKSPPLSSASKRPITPSEFTDVSGSVNCLKTISQTTTKTSKLSYCGLSSSGDVDQPYDAWNSTMQLIYCTSDQLRNYFINRMHQSNGPFHRVIGSTLQEMVEVSNRATERRSPPSSPTDSSQNDSELSLKCPPDKNVQTLLSSLLQGVHQESNGYVARKLAIQVETKVICSKCATQQKSQSIEWACVIDLPSEATNDSENESSLFDLMEESKTEVQLLNCACLSCAKPQASTITKSIHRSSQMFLLYLDRFKSEGKVSSPVLIEEELEIATKEYILSGAILHQGSSLKSGHYSTLIREANDQWVVCDDERIGLEYRNGHAKQMLAYLACVLMYREVEIKEPIEARQLGNSKVRGQQIVYGPACDPNANLDEWLNISRIFGVAESSNFIGPLPQNGEAYSGITSQPESFKPEPYGYCGLQNLGLTCYVNSTLQALYTSTRIRHYLIEHPTSGPMHAALSKLFLRMETESARKSSSIIPSVSLNPVEFVTKLREVKPMFGPYQMHDAQEFLTILLELIHQETNQAKKAVTSPQSAQTALEAWNYHVCHIDDSYLSRMFMGQLENVLTCGRCGNASRSWMCVWQLQAQLETEESLSSVCNKVTLTNIVTLKQCLKEYTMEETLTGDCTPFCSQCKSRQPATKRQSVIRLAHYLIVHLKRFAYDGTKIHCPVSIDERLYFAGATFLLSSAVCHSGTETVGHYYSLYRERDNQWVWLNDATITKHMNNKEAHELLQAYGYLFIYRAIQQDAPLDTGAGFTSSQKKTGEVPEQGVQQGTSNKDP